MPARNSVKTFIENGYYHVYNRGVEGRVIFIDDRDYRTFLSLLRYYLSPPHPDDFLQQRRSLYGKISLLSYCLMPNHFHLQLKQTTLSGMTELLRAVATSYVTYFNARYKRFGTLFQGKYKASLIETQEYLLYLTAYIHRNPLNLDRVGSWTGSDPLRTYPYSSYQYFLTSPPPWLHPQEILEQFQSTHHHQAESYQDFVEGITEDLHDMLGNSLLD